MINNGKKLRSLLASLTYKVCTEGHETLEEYERALDGGIAIELAHNASLVHDDIIDGDKFRRGKKTFYMEYGLKYSIAYGHKMLCMAYAISINHGLKFTKLFLDTWEKAIDGEEDELNFYKSIENKTDLKTLIEKYNNIIENKTASLFSAACVAGGLQANANIDLIRQLYRFGNHIGIAYQLADDYIDFRSGEKIHSVIYPVYSDIFKISDFSNKKISNLYEILSKNLDIVDTYFNMTINKNVEKAKNIANSKYIPNSKYKKILFNAPEYIIHSMLEHK